MLLEKREQEVIVRSVVLAFGDMVASELACFKAYGSINACQERSIKSVINTCQEQSIKSAINACQDMNSEHEHGRGAKYNRYPK